MQYLGTFCGRWEWTLVEGFGQARTWIPRLWKAKNFGCNALYYPLFFPSRELPVQGSWVLETGFGTLSKPELEIVSSPLPLEFIVFQRSARTPILGISNGLTFRIYCSVLKSIFGEPKAYPTLGSKLSPILGALGSIFGPLWGTRNGARFGDQKWDPILAPYSIYKKELKWGTIFGPQIWSHFWA